MKWIYSTNYFHSRMVCFRKDGGNQYSVQFKRTVLGFSFWVTWKKPVLLMPFETTDLLHLEESYNNFLEKQIR